MAGKIILHWEKDPGIQAGYVATTSLYFRIAHIIEKNLRAANLSYPLTELLVDVGAESGFSSYMPVFAHGQLPPAGHAWLVGQ